ncbi:hypothetical protein FJZ26_04580, partial [Candidatus Parvarchaeota archaeon]|nr:hypothetical protein [Candidatus Parvarchaeota archaeon]
MNVTQANFTVGVPFNLSLRVANFSGVINGSYQPCTSDLLFSATNNSTSYASNGTSPYFQFPVVLNASTPFVGGYNNWSVNITQAGNHSITAASSCGATGGGQLNITVVEGGQQGPPQNYQSFTLNVSSQTVQKNSYFNLTLSMFLTNGSLNATYQACTNDIVNSTQVNVSYYLDGGTTYSFPVRLNTSSTLGNFSNGRINVSVMFNLEGNYTLTATSSCALAGQGSINMTATPEVQPTGNSTISGYVVNASNQSQAIINQNLMLTRGGAFFANGMSNGSGYYNFSYLPNGNYTVMSTGINNGSVANIFLSGNNNTTINLSITVNLPPPPSTGNVTVQGYVKRPDGNIEATSGIQIRINTFQGPSPQNTTNASGFYIIYGIPPGSNFKIEGNGPQGTGIFIQQSDLRNSSGGLTIFNNSAITQNVTISSGEGGGGAPFVNCGGNATITGRVVNTSGANLSNVLIFAINFQTQQGLQNQQGPSQFCGTSATTDANGTFTIVNLTSGVYMLMARDQNSIYASEMSGDPFLGNGVFLPQNSSVGSYNFTLSKGGSVNGFVLNNATGTPTPLKFSFVKAVKANCVFGSGVDCMGGGSQTDQNGQYSFTLKQGNYTLQVEGNSWQGLGSASVNVEVTAGSNITQNITLSQGQKLHGYVLSGGVAVNQGMNIMVRPAASTGNFFGQQLFGQVSPSNGSYEVYGISQGLWDVEVQPFGNSNFGKKTVKDVNVTGSGNYALNISLSAGSSIVGDVNCSGVPVQNGWIFAKSENNVGFGTGFENGFGANVINGRYQISGVTPGVYSLFLDFWGSSCSRENKFGIGVREGATTTVNFILTSGSTLSGKINTSGGLNIS